MSTPAFMRPQWPVPPQVQAAFSLRTGGVSAGAYASLNVGAHVGDQPERVTQNRARVRAALRLPTEPLWLEQVHGTEVFDPDRLPASRRDGADAVVIRRAGVVAVIQVADCLPVLLAARDGSCIAAAHAGWRGLAAGVLEATVRALALDPRQLMAWLGPAIGPRHFEVGEEVRAAFMPGEPGVAAAFVKNPRGRWQCDLAALARLRLRALGLTELRSVQLCTYEERERFFSYRRDGQCGRMAALIWLT